MDGAEHDVLESSIREAAGAQNSPARNFLGLKTRLWPWNFSVAAPGLKLPRLGKTARGLGGEQSKNWMTLSKEGNDHISLSK